MSLFRWYNKSTAIPFLRIFLCATLTLPLLYSCESSTSIDEEPPFVSSYEIIIPAIVNTNQPVPIVVRAKNQDPRLLVWNTFYLSSPNAVVLPNEIMLKRGAGSVSVDITGIGNVSLELSSQSGSLLAFANVLVENVTAYRNLSGTLAGDDLQWDTSSVIHITADAYIPAGETLLIAPGTRVEIDHLVSVIVEGEVHCSGTKSFPVLFSASEPDDPWGEIDHSSNAFYSYTFFTNGGGDASKAFGHSESQPVLRGENNYMQLENVYIIDNPGKALGTTRCTIQMDSCLISRCDTGGEMKYPSAVIENCYFIDMPDGNEVEVDDDNDGLYMMQAFNNDEASYLIRCVFVTGKDDGLDHNGANLKVIECIFEDFDNEGIAASNENEIEIINTLVTSCGQGIEAGYGSPLVKVDHCTLIENHVGLRFGDSYNWGCYGTMIVTNTICVNNLNYNVWNYDYQIEGPREDALDITYSIVNEPLYDEGEGCLTGMPEFTDTFQLSTGSIGTGAASDGLDMGILP